MVIASKPISPFRITLSISSISEVVSVSVDDSAPQISTEVSENQSATNIERDALDRVPVFDQDYVSLLSRFLSDDAVATSGVSLVVNGVEANGPGVSPSAVQEVKINQNPYSSRFARPGRARLEITTKPGTPQFHGTVNFRTRNSFLDASNALSASKPAESRYLEEGSLTGPLDRDKKNTAYAPTVTSKTVFRGGAGIFYDRSGPRPIADLLHFNGENLLRYILSSNAQYQIPYPVTPSDYASVPTSLVVLDPRLRIPYIFQYSFGIEHQVTAKSTFSATYVGTRGIDLFRSRDINAPLPPAYLERPNTTNGQIRQMESEGYQKGSALELTFRGKPTKWFSGQAQYTLGKSYNNTSGITYFPGNSNFASLDWARSDNDRRHKFDLLGSFSPTDLFSLGVALQAYSGKPVNVITGLDSNGDGIFNDRPDGGLAPRNSLHGPGLVNLDFNIEHDFHFRKEKKQGPILTASLNIFNVFNHPNYVTYIGVIGPDGGPRNPNFGLPSAANPGRHFQINLELKF